MTTTIVIMTVLAALLLGLVIGFLGGTLKGRQTGEERIRDAEARLATAESET